MLITSTAGTGCERRLAKSQQVPEVPEKKHMQLLVGAVLLASIPRIWAGVVELDGVACSACFLGSGG